MALADYLLALKGNHRQAHRAVADYFNQTCFDRGSPGQAVLDKFDDGHGRLVRRRVFVSTEAAGLEALRCWPGLHAVLAVETIRSVNGTAKTVAELRYFLTSGIDAPEVLAACRSEVASEFACRVDARSWKELARKPEVELGSRGIWRSRWRSPATGGRFHGRVMAPCGISLPQPG